ncbi:MAG TPA: hypothetical protein PK198_17500, partial [Saprospiraceae bacterium]|nr:hypothetical protein [Saprospiraceae bacterium]
TANADAFSATGINFISPDFAGANDTCFVDTGLNTTASAYSYRVRFYSASNLLGASEPASSVRLSIVPTDRANQLSWTEMVPWDNYRYTIFRKNTAGSFDSLSTVIKSPYTDGGLVNGQEYCYLVRSEGTYGVTFRITNGLGQYTEVTASLPIHAGETPLFKDGFEGP